MRSYNKLKKCFGGNEAGTITQDQETAIINSLTSFTNKTSQN